MHQARHLYAERLTTRRHGTVTSPHAPGWGRLTIDGYLFWLRPLPEATSGHIGYRFHARVGDDGAGLVTIIDDDVARIRIDDVTIAVNDSEHDDDRAAALVVGLQREKCDGEFRDCDLATSRCSVTIVEPLRWRDLLPWHREVAPEIHLDTTSVTAELAADVIVDRLRSEGILPE